MSYINKWFVWFVVDEIMKMEEIVVIVRVELNGNV